MFGWLLKGVGSAAKGIGDAVVGVIKVTKGDKAAVEAAVADEQLAVLAEHAAEFAARGERTKLDSVADALNRLPRPLFALFIFFIFLWPFFDVAGFVEYMRAMDLVPDTIWTLFLTILSFYFGGRIIAADLKKPKMSPEQKKLALDIIREREQVILENRTPLIVERPASRKPPPPPWAREPADEPIIHIPEPATEPGPGKRPEIIDRIIEEILAKEGGFCNDPADSGGATNWGITRESLSSWRNRECTVDDVMSLTKDEACDIYRSEYWLKPGVDSLAIGLQSHVTDCCVNCGPRTGLKLLQRALNQLGANIKEDGFVGPSTRDACSKYPEAEIHNALADVRVRYYTELAARRKKDSKFLRGWLARANSFRVN